MKPAKPTSNPQPVPPQLIGIIDDARRENINTFTLEYSRNVVMASFSAPNHASEIDFELEAGEEMLRFLRNGAPSLKAKQWRIRCVYDSETYVLQIQRTSKNSQSPLRVKWSVLPDEKGA
jgi:hypothetical protein